MAAKSLTDEELQDALDLVEQHGSVAEASRHTDLKRSTFESRYQRAKDILGEQPKTQTDDVSLPEFPDVHGFKGGAVLLDFGNPCKSNIV